MHPLKTEDLIFTRGRGFQDSWLACLRAIRSLPEAKA